MTPHEQTCHAFAEDLSAFIDGELAPVDAGRAERHIVECAECRRTVEALRGAASAVGSLPRMAAPSDLLARVRQAMPDHAQHGRSASSADVMRAASADIRRVRTLRWIWSVSGVAAVLVAAVVLTRNLWIVEPPVLGVNPAVALVDPVTRGGEAPRIARRDEPGDGREARLGEAVVPADKLAANGGRMRPGAGGGPDVIARTEVESDDLKSKTRVAVIDMANSAKEETLATAMKKAAAAQDDTLGLDPLTRKRLAELGYIGDDENAVEDAGFLDALTQSTDAELMESIVAAVPGPAEPANETNVGADDSPITIVDVVCVPQDDAEYNSALDAQRQLYFNNREAVIPQQRGGAANWTTTVGAPPAELRDQAVAGRGVVGGGDSFAGGGKTAGDGDQYYFEPADTELAVSPALANDWVNYLANSAPRRVAVAAPLDVCRLIQSSDAFQKQQLVLVENPTENTAADPSATIAELGRAIQTQSETGLSFGVPISAARDDQSAPAGASETAQSENLPASAPPESALPQSAAGEARDNSVARARSAESTPAEGMTARKPARANEATAPDTAERRSARGRAAPQARESSDREPVSNQSTPPVASDRLGARADTEQRRRQTDEGRTAGRAAIEPGEYKNEPAADSERSERADDRGDLGQSLKSLGYVEGETPTSQQLRYRDAARGQVLLRVRILPPPQQAASQPAQTR